MIRTVFLACLISFLAACSGTPLKDPLSWEAFEPRLEQLISLEADLNFLYQVMWGRRFDVGLLETGEERESQKAGICRFLSEKMNEGSFDDRFRAVKLYSVLIRNGEFLEEWMRTEVLKEVNERPGKGEASAMVVVRHGPGSRRCKTTRHVDKAGYFLREEYSEEVAFDGRIAILLLGPRGQGTEELAQAVAARFGLESSHVEIFESHSKP